jgi:hypothetical protein
LLLPFAFGATLPLIVESVESPAEITGDEPSGWDVFEPQLAITKVAARPSTERVCLIAGTYPDLKL